MEKEVLEKIKKIEKRLDILERTIKAQGKASRKSEPQTIDMDDLFALPNSLQKTILAMKDLGEATSTDVSKKTGRDRTVESIYLNQLSRLGYLSKERRGHRLYFKILRFY